MAYWFITKQKGWGLYAECGMCRSMKITRTEINDTGEVYEAMYKCLDCGAVAKVREWWAKDN